MCVVTQYLLVDVYIFHPLISTLHSRFLTKFLERICKNYFWNFYKVLIHVCVAYSKNSNYFPITWKLWRRRYKLHWHHYLFVARSSVWVHSNIPLDILGRLSLSCTSWPYGAFLHTSFIIQSTALSLITSLELRNIGRVP